MYARARAAMLDGQNQTSINLLEKAVALDPWSYELRYTLARLYLGDRASDERSIVALEQAATLEPDHLALQLNLGRQYLDRNQTEAGVSHLLLSLRTSDYARDGAEAAVADYFLAHALQRGGYDAAAVTLYRRLGVRLRNPSYAMRATPELAVLADRPEVLDVQIGALEQKRGRYEEALAAVSPAADADVTNFDLQARVIRLLLLARRPADAQRRAGELVVRRHADEDSLNLLREMYRGGGKEGRAADELGALYAAHPAQRRLLYAHADQLRALGRLEEARRVLERSTASFPEDFELARRRFALFEAQGDRGGAARYLIESVARQPDWAGQAGELFTALVRPASRNRLRLAALQSLEVTGTAEGSKLYWLSKVASLWHREDAARAALEKAVAARPLFAPAWREWLDLISSDPELSELAKQEAAANLATAAERAGAPALAAELEGLELLRREQPVAAAVRIAEAVKRGGRAPELLVAQATAQRSAGDAAAFEATLWKLISDHPAFRDGYLELYGYYAARRAEAQTARVLTAWLANDPSSIGARRLQAREYFRSGRTAAAEAILLRLYKEYPEDPDVIDSLGAVYLGTHRSDAFVSTLRQRLNSDPHDFAVVPGLIQVYQSQHRSADAAQVLDAAHNAIADDPDLLYTLSGLYARNDERRQSEEVLRQVLALEPDHAGANNDLGYFLSEEGKDLSEAEVLIRRAVAADAHNSSFLDSLGWVLYKRGRFDAARAYLDKAVLGADPDPVVLNHLGDVLYQLGERAAAGKSWDRAWTRADQLADAGSDRHELTSLRAQLKQKREQLHAGRPVEVSPVAEAAPNVSASK